MLNLTYAPIFVRQFKKLEAGLQEEALEKIELFKDISNHQKLHVHKLAGRFTGRYSFSVNYAFRIVFSYAKRTEVNMLAIGDHSIYK